MGRPAARVGDMHICPMVTPGLPPIPHVGGPVLPPGVPTVLIGNMPAAVMGNLCTCVGPPDTIVKGSTGVFIASMPAARILDPTVHGGNISFGLGTVLIGEVNASAAVVIFPGQQNYGNCGVQSAAQIIQQATDQVLGEDEILNTAIANGWADDSNTASQRGGTGAGGREDILDHYGVSSTEQGTTRENISNALVNRQGVIVNADAGVLWGDARYAGGGHAVTIVDGDWNDQGELTHVYINDTGTGEQGRQVPIDDLMDATDAHPNSTLNVTDDPIWE